MRWPDRPATAAGRRAVLAASLGTAAGLALGWPRRAGANEADQVATAALLRDGGVVVAMRHALAPGTFDPPGFTLGDCSTQRNLNEAGRAQSRRIGAWFQQRQLLPAAVRSSPWCRCLETARLAFGDTQTWPALGSPHGTGETVRSQQRDELQLALRGASARPGRFEVWVTHAFVQSDLAGQSTGSGEALILRADAQGRPQLLARLAVG